jgi:nucleotide-binding universal stress UspA family protein
MAQPHHPSTVVATSRAVLSRVVCGIDGSTESELAAREASLLAPDGGQILLVSALTPHLVESVVSAIPGAPEVFEASSRSNARAEIEAAREGLRSDVGCVSTICAGPAAMALQMQAQRYAADTIAVGGHGHHRTAGVLLGRVATQLVHSADRSVLLSRAVAGTPAPESIAVGIDYSPPSLVALSAARVLADRLRVPLRVLCAGDRAHAAADMDDVDEPVEQLRGYRSTAEALACHVTNRDLLVVGSRGMRGLRALGSVSEAVAHRAPCSVLIVR